MAGLISCDISSEIPTPSNSALTFKEREYSRPISSISLMQMAVLIWLGRRVMWEIEESTILFTLMGDVFSPVNQFRGSFSHAESRSEKTNRARLTTIKKATCFSKLKSQALNRHLNSPTMFEFSFTYAVYVFQL